MELNNLISFLQKRAAQLNRKIHMLMSILEPLLEKCDVKAILEMENTILGYHQTIANVIELLRQIGQSRTDEVKTGEDEVQIGNRILDEMLNRTISREYKYDCFHPLYGYTPFREKLLEQLLSLENYEYCREIVAINKTTE